MQAALQLLGCADCADEEEGCFVCLSFGFLSIKTRYKVKSMRRPAIVASGPRSFFDLHERLARRPINSGTKKINKSKNKSVFILL